MRRSFFAAMVLIAAVSVSSSAAALEWPFRIEAGDTVITIYMPQIENFEGDIVTARSAVSISISDKKTPVFGAIWFEAYALTDRESRTVVLSDVDILSARFPSMEGQALERYRQISEAEIEKWEFLITLDDMKAALELVDRQQAAAAGIRNAPPKIIYMDEPAVLITIDGEPREQKLEDAGLSYVVNTPFFIVSDPESGIYYLRGGPWWYSSRKVDSGYTPVERVPEAVAGLAEAAEKAEAEAAAEGEDVPENPDSVFAGREPPEIVVTTEPAELVTSDGEAEFAPVEDTYLLYMTNTDSDVFIDTTSQLYFILISGRWYAAPSMDGDWRFVEADALPEDFSMIPPDSENGHVLASVAGTEQARDAVLDMYVPQTAEVDRAEAEVEVTYDGEPRFEDIEDTGMSYAVNTSSPVIRAGGLYYCCDEAVWFVSASPAGPWDVCVEVPASIYTIPPSCPVYNVVYVRVYDYTPDVVYVGYTPGYTCSYVYGGTVVYGTGWYYRPWYGRYYYPRPVTWGFGVHWNPWTGWSFSVGMRFGGPYGWFRVGWGYRPYGYWGPRGYWGGYNRAYRYGYRHGYHHGAMRGYASGYRAGRQQAVSRNLYKNRATGVKRTGEIRTAQKRPAGTPSTMDRTRPSGSRNDVYVGRDGNVYRRDQGKWEKQTGRTRESATRQKEVPVTDLERYRAARDKGARDNDRYDRQRTPAGRDTRDTNTGRETRQQPSSRDTRQKSSQSRDTRQKSTRSADTRQKSSRPVSSGQRNTKSAGSRRTSSGRGRK